MIEELTAKNLALEERVQSLLEDIETYEQVRSMGSYSVDF